MERPGGDVRTGASELKVNGDARQSLNPTQARNAQLTRRKELNLARQYPMKKDSYTISSGWGPRAGGFHYGLDFAAPDGTPFYACAGGRVLFIGAAQGYGQWIVIDHPASEGGGCTEYGHMWNAFATGLKAGDWVSAGQLIGYVGSNGGSTGPHLHLTVWEC